GRRRINQPGCMKGNGHAEKHAPKHYAPASENKKQQPQHDQRDEKKAVKPDVITILYEVGSVTLDCSLVMILGCAAQDPTNVRPPAAIARRVWITAAVSMCMMYAVSEDPLNARASDGPGDTSPQKELSR